MKRAGRIVRVVDASEVAGARRNAVQCAEALRLNETSVAKAALAATELATNLIKHGDGGSMLFGSDEEQRLVIVTIDKGRGITNVGAALRDGYSTAGSSGTGLGAVRRASSSFDLYSLEGRGTVVVCSIYQETPRSLPKPQAPQRIDVGGVCVPKPGEETPGDDWTATFARDTATISIADGLGHGMAAAMASGAAVRVFESRPELDPDRLLEEAHGALRSTRGAAVGIARIHATAGRLDFSGVGNIAGTIADEDRARRVVSLTGIVGHEMRKVQTFSYPWTESSVLVMHSDGIGTSWNPANYPGLMQRDPLLIAAVIFRDFCRGNDDATVVVAKGS